MAGETDLDSLLAAMGPRLRDGEYVFATLAAGTTCPPSLRPVMTFEEGEGLTLILRREEAEVAGLAFGFPCRMITLTVHSSLEAIGFLAAITAELAAAAIAVNPVSAFHHDHLFVPAGRADEAMEILRRLAH